MLPPLAFWVTKRICLSLQRHDRDKVLHGRESGTIIRTAEGRFFEKHEPLDEYERWTLVQQESPEPLAIGSQTDANGVAAKGARSERIRARLSNFYFKDRVAPVTPAELAAAHHHGEHEAISSTRDLRQPRGAAGDPGPRPAGLGARGGQARAGEGPLSRSPSTGSSGQGASVRRLLRPARARSRRVALGR